MDEVLLETLLAAAFAVILIGTVLFFYFRKNRKETNLTKQKIERAITLGIYEPISLHPVVDTEICIGSGACIQACPEKDILGLINGQTFAVNASNCVGHGACFHACPIQAVTLCIGTEKRGVDLPHVGMDYSSNIPGIYIAGELGGMGLIKNAMDQGVKAVQYIKESFSSAAGAEYDLIIVGAGPAGIGAALAATKHNLRYLVLEQDSIGGTVYSFPRAKVIMTRPVDLPLQGKLKLNETTKTELLSIWHKIIAQHKLQIRELEKVSLIQKKDSHFDVITPARTYTASRVLLAIGRRGTPRKLGVPGEEKEKVFYRMLEPEHIQNKHVLVVGGGDSAIESAMLVVGEGNTVTLSYRGESFSRLKPRNLENITKAIERKDLTVMMQSNVIEIKDDNVVMTMNNNTFELPNDLVYVFAGGELPNEFLKKAGIFITKKFGDAILKHD